MNLPRLARFVNNPNQMTAKKPLRKTDMGAFVSEGKKVAERAISTARTQRDATWEGSAAGLESQNEKVVHMPRRLGIRRSK
jgi:hypothetical protein